MKPRKLLNVLPECYVDTNLIEYLLDAGVNHQHSCSKVVGQLNTIFADSFAVGIIDKDKVELGYVKECKTIAKTEHLTLLRHNFRPQYLVIVTAVDKLIKRPQDNPTIGILICQKVNREKLKWTLEGFNKLMGVSTYTYNLMRMVEKHLDALQVVADGKSEAD